MRAFRLDKKRSSQRKKEKTPKYKRRRLQLKKERKIRDKACAVREGDTYQADIDLTADQFDCETIPDMVLDKENNPKLFFDLETTGLGRNVDIIQIAASCGDKMFNRYVLPRKTITKGATGATGITYENGDLIRNNKPLSAVTIPVALMDFVDFIKTFDKPVIIGHNIAAFDVPILFNRLKEFNMVAEFNSNISYFVDTLTLARAKYKRPHIENHKQETLVRTLLGKTYDAHNAESDVRALQDLYVTKLSDCNHQNAIFHLNSHVLKKSYTCSLKSYK